MKASYTFMVFALCLNLGTYITGAAGLFTTSSPISPWGDVAAQTAKLNTTATSNSLAQSGGSVWDISVGLAVVNMFAGLFAGFPAWVLTIPWVPGYLSAAVILLYTLVYATFVFEIVLNRNVTGEL